MNCFVLILVVCCCLVNIFLMICLMTLNYNAPLISLDLIHLSSYLISAYKSLLKYACQLFLISIRHIELSMVRANSKLPTGTIAQMPT